MRALINLLLFTSMIIISSCGENDSQQRTIIKPVKSTHSFLSSELEWHSFSGMTVADNETKMSFKLGGTLSSLHVKLGDHVKKGQLVASIDPVDYDIQLEQAKAQQQAAEANMKSAESQLINIRASFKRVEKLYENNSVSLSEYQQSKAALASTESQYKASESQVHSAMKQVEAAMNQMSYSRLLAPVDGVISNVLVEKNELVGAGQVIAVISSKDDPRIQVGLPELFINDIQAGQKVLVELTSIKEVQFNGTIEEIAFASGSTPTYPVIVSLDEGSDQIRPGMAADVHFRFEREGELAKEKVLAPVQCLGKDTEGYFVFVLNKNENGNFHVEKRQVEIGEILPDGFEVISGLKENEMLAAAGLNTLLEGMEVKLLK